MIVALMIATGFVWAVHASALGIPPVALLAPTAISVALFLLVPSATVFRIATAIELFVVRFVAHQARYYRWIISLFVLYSVGLGVALRPWAIELTAVTIVGLTSFIVFGYFLRYVTQSLFASNVKGPTFLGALALVFAVSMPLTAYTVGLLRPDLAAWFGCILVVYGLCCAGRAMWVGLARFVETTQAVTDIPLERVKSYGLAKLVRWTERSLNRSLIQRGAFGYAACFIIYVCGGVLSTNYRMAFLGLRVQKLYSSRHYRKVIQLTNDAMTGSLLYLRGLSLIRSGQVESAEMLLASSIARWPANPYLHFARAQLHLETLGFFSEPYRRDVDTASQLAMNRVNADSKSYVCPDAIAEHGKITAFTTAVGPVRNESNPEARRKQFTAELFEVAEARRIAARHSVRLASEVRGVEGIVQSLSGDFREGYEAFLDALATGENLKARYHLAVLLMIGSATFLRPIYHLERILVLAPRDSRLARLTKARLEEALEITRANRALSMSWGVFRLLTFDRRYLELAECEQAAWAALAYREDDNKKRAYKRIFGHEPPREAAVPPWTPAGWTWESLRRSHGDEDNERLKRDARVGNIS